MRIGSLTLETNLFLSPLAGYTNLPFRLIVRSLGGVGLCTTDLVNARSLLEKRRAAFELIATAPGDSPLAVQLFGSVPEEMRDAALVAEARGAASVDINMGCPVRKVVGVGGGAAMMTAWTQTAALVRKMVEAVKIPVTAKMRLGWDADNITAPDLAKALEDVGIAAVFVHGRTRQQGFGGIVNLAGIRAVREAVKGIPVIGNGDVTTAEAAKMMIEETGVAGVGIGRGALVNPWLFKETVHLFKTGERLGEVGFEERVSLMQRHLDLIIEVFGEKRGCVMFRKVAPCYAKRFGPSHEFNKGVVHVATREDFQGVMENYLKWRKQFLDERGELLPRFRPAPVVAAFMQTARAAEKGEMTMPKGPVERW